MNVCDRVESYREIEMFPSLSLMSCEWSEPVKENPDRKKNIFHSNVSVFSKKSPYLENKEKQREQKRPVNLDIWSNGGIAYCHLPLNKCVQS